MEPWNSSLFVLSKDREERQVAMSNQEPRTENREAPEAEAEAAPRASFEELELLPEVAEAIAEMGFEEPTPVQAETYGPVMNGEDLIVMAQTGTGKTAAFGIPLVQKLDPEQGRVQVLTLAPTRELALQVSREVSQIGERRGVQCAAVYGGASFSKQVDEVRAGAQFVVGTPGRVLDHMRRGTIDFGSVRFLVLDEADEMLSMGFEKELSEIIERLPRQRQALLFSATIPDDIQRLSGRYMSDSRIISVSGDAVAAAEISHFVYLVSGVDRPGDLVRVIENEQPDSAIVFCNTRDETQVVARYLADHGYDADWINSDLSQAERERVMTATRSGELRFMVATDVAARGIDISHLSHVINFSFPESLEVYVHRTGRTGRQGRHGAAVSLITPHDVGNLYFLRLTYKIFPVERSLPSSERAVQDREIERLHELKREVVGAGGRAHESLARRILQDVDAERVVAGLLERQLGPLDEGDDRDDDTPKRPRKRRRRRKAETEKPRAETEKPRAETEKPRAEPEKPRAEIEKPRAKPERPAPEPERPAPEPEKPRAEPERPAPEPVSPEARARLDDAAKSAGDEESYREIYLDAGRKDGLKISTLMKDIVERTGLPRSAVGRVRMLTRATFVAVPDESFDRVLAALGELEVDGRRLKAEPAKER